MRKQLIAMTAFTIGTLCLASAAMAGEGGAEHRGPVDNEAVQPARLQGSNIGGYQNSSSGSAATSSSDSSGDLANHNLRRPKFVVSVADSPKRLAAWCRGALAGVGRHPLDDGLNRLTLSSRILGLDDRDEFRKP